MKIKTSKKYAFNFDLKKRKKRQIIFLIFHYTGMISEKAAIKRLTGIQPEVSSHYLIKNNGEIVILVPELYIAWHAGISQWHKKKQLNKCSIGIEISNPGHQNGYKNFSKKQINSLIKLSRYLIKKYKIKKNFVLGHSDISPDRKLDPGEKFPWNLLFKNKIGIWHNLNERKLSLLRGKKVSNFENKHFMKNLKKIGYTSKSKICKSKQKFQKLLIKAFQRRFRQKKINGKIDQECLLISKKLVRTT
jgi:N-acetylmuramoyl-L-alanine amidase